MRIVLINGQVLKLERQQDHSLKKKSNTRRKACFIIVRLKEKAGKKEKKGGKQLNNIKQTQIYSQIRTIMLHIET